MDISSLLEKIGLTQTEAAVYLAALSRPHVSAAELAEVTSLKRPRIYHALETLGAKGLVAKIGSSKTARFRAEQPEQLKTILKRKEIEIQGLEKRVEKALPLFPSSGDVPLRMGDLEYFHGHEGLRNLLELVMKQQGDIVYAINPSFDIIRKAVDMSYGVFYLEERAKRGIKTKSIWQDFPNDKKVENHKKYLREMRVAPKQTLGDIRTSINIFDNSVILVNFLPELFGVHIKSHDYTQTMKALWQALWSISKPIDPKKKQ